MRLSNKDRSFLSVAKFLATKSSQKNMHGALVVKSGRVVGMGWNRHRNDPNFISEEHIKEHATYHAEQVAIRDAGDNVAGATIYVARVNRHGEDRNSKPCPLCEFMLANAGIKKIIYTTEGVTQDVRN